MVSELLRERLGPTSEYVSSLIQIQAAYINTNHPDFVAGSAAIARAGAPKPVEPPKVRFPYPLCLYLTVLGAIGCELTRR